VAVTIGLVGAGRRAAAIHAPAIAACAAVRFAGVWARSPDAARALARAHDVRSFDRYPHLLDACDAVAFAVPPAAQVDLAATAARRGRAVLLERPIAGDLAGAEELADAVARTRVVSQVALAWRYSAAVRRFLATGVPGTEPAGGSGRVVARPVVGGGPWRVEQGLLQEGGTDLLDLLDAALGPVVGVRAHGDRHGWLGLLLDHRAGRFSEASLYTTAAGGPERAGVEVFGPGGSAAVDCSRVAGPETFDAMYREFGAAVDGGRAPEVDVRHGLRLQQVIEAAESDLVGG
jgi:predicted dehydrogenase